MRILSFGKSSRKRKNGSKNPLTTGIVLLVIVAGGIVLWLAPQLASIKTQYMKDRLGLSEDSINKIPQQVSTSYILGADAIVLQGETIKPTNRGPMYRVVFQTTSAAKDLIAEYKAFFTRASWKIQSEAEVSGLTVVAFDRGLEGILLSASAKGLLTEATLMLDPERQ